MPFFLGIGAAGTLAGVLRTPPRTLTIEVCTILRAAVARSCTRACARCAHPGLDAGGLSRGEVPASLPLERLGALADASYSSAPAVSVRP